MKKSQVRDGIVIGHLDDPLLNNTLILWISWILVINLSSRWFLPDIKF